MNPATLAREQAERWLDELDIERDRIVRLIADLRRLEHEPALLLSRRPHRQLKAVLQNVEREMRARA